MSAPFPPEIVAAFEAIALAASIIPPGGPRLIVQASARSIALDFCDPARLAATPGAQCSDWSRDGTGRELRGVALPLPSGWVVSARQERWNEASISSERT